MNEYKEFMIECKNESLKFVIEQINKARVWALNHFNYNGRLNQKLIDENFNLAKPNFFVEFPDTKTMIVSPSVIGTPHSLVKIEYKLIVTKKETY